MPRAPELPDDGPTRLPGQVSALIDLLDVWLDEHWDPQLDVATWWDLLARAGWAAPALPTAAGGRGATAEDAAAVGERLAERGVLGPPSGTAMAIILPTILEHGSDEQVAAFVPEILAGRSAWCLLLSEPNAGSDLAALTTAAHLDGDEWIVDGRKTWATGAHLADRALLLTRSDPSAARHRGLSALVIDLHQPDVEVRPMREMTGRALSNDVYLTGARVPAAAVLGEVGGGWAVVQTAVTAERRTVGGAHAATARPGSVAGDLDLRAGDLTTAPAPKARRPASAESPAALVERFTRTSDAARRAALRQDVARLHTLAEVARLTARRSEAAVAAGTELPGAANIAKLLASEIARQAAQLGLLAAGPTAMLHGYRSGQRTGLAAALADDADDREALTALVLSAPAVSLVGGVDRLQRDLLGERVLGLPKSPAPPAPPADPPAT